MTVLTATSPAPSGAASSASSRTAASGPTLGQADFLRLLTAQMTQQDPLNPLDNNAFVAQMAQFSQVSGLAEINQSLSEMTSLLRGNASGTLASWIGRNALLDSEVAMPLDDGKVHGLLALDRAEPQAVLSLVDATGTVVASQQLDDLPAGEHGFALTPPPDSAGPFQVTLSSASGSSGSQISTWTQIIGVRSPAAGADARLITPGGSVDPASIRRLG